MPEDLKIFDLVGNNSTLVGSIWPGSARVDGEYSLIQKIAKCLLTRPGESEYDPDFGADIRAAIRGLSGQEIDTARKIISSSLSKVLEDLGRDLPDDPAQRLRDLRIADLTYEAETTSWVVAVEVETDATIVTFSLGA
jgi:hypothetical protein